MFMLDSDGRIEQVALIIVLSLAILPFTPLQVAGAQPTIKSSVSAPNQVNRFPGLVAEAMAAYEARRIEEAVRLARQADSLSSSSKLPVSPEYARALNTMGIVYFYTGLNREAADAYYRALEQSRLLRPSDDKLLANVLNNLGQIKGRTGENQAARGYLEEALALRKASPDTHPIALAGTRDNLGFIYNALGEELDDAEKLHWKALAAFASIRGPFSEDVATTLGNLAALYLSRRDYQKAEAYGLRALDTHLRLGGLEDASTLIDLGFLVKLYLKTGDELRAESLVKLLVSIGGETPTVRHLVTAQTLSHLGEMAYSQFALGLAQRLTTRAVEIYEVAVGPAAPETLDAVHLLANILSAKRSTYAAEEKLIYLLNAYGSEEVQKRAQARIDLGKLLRNRGKESYPAALEMFKHAIEDLRKEEPLNRELLASAIGNLGELYYRNEQPALAEERYDEALTLVEHDTASLEKPWLLYNRAMLWYHTKRYQLAIDGYQKAAGIWSSLHSSEHPFVATTQMQLALVYWIEGDTGKALEMFRKANRIMEAGALRTLTVGSEQERLAYASGMLDELYKVISYCFSLPTCDAEASNLAGTMLLQRKGRVLDALSHSFSALRENLDSEGRKILDSLTRVREQLSEVVAPLHFSRELPRNRAELARLQEKEDELSARLSRHSLMHYSHLDEVSTDAVMDAIPENAALLEFVGFAVFEPRREGSGTPWATEHYAALVLRKGEEPRWFKLGPAVRIERIAKKLRQRLRDRFSQDVDKAASALYDELIAPLEFAIQDADMLLVSPDGALNLVPFEVLGAAAGERLGDRYTVSYLHSGRDLLRGKETVKGTSGVVVIANPDFEADVPDASTRGGNHYAESDLLESLPGTAEEAEKISSLFKGVTRIEGKNATVEALQAISGPTVLHVATHGVFTPLKRIPPRMITGFIPSSDQMLMITRAEPSAMKNPMLYSGLVLAGANRKIDGKRAGVLTALEAASLDLRGTELVVLSACETGVGTSAIGEEFAGLRRALAIAGAASQTTSLWRVSDKASAALMTRYYELLASGLGRAVALQRARDYVKSRPGWKHPYYWAAFISSGDWRPIAGLSELLHNSSIEESTIETGVVRREPVN